MASNFQAELAKVQGVASSLEEKLDEAARLISEQEKTISRMQESEAQQRDGYASETKSLLAKLSAMSEEFSKEKQLLDNEISSVKGEREDLRKKLSEIHVNGAFARMRSISRDLSSQGNAEEEERSGFFRGSCGGGDEQWQGQSGGKAGQGFLRVPGSN
ncbi:uncharacterized protein LOC9658617 [Selaginella moellendorffii]|uniref:uncharacterized protein LOC9658617 n=1 Tax=Selaginella moellendorffii TaxID=88036 RepID=UPI000D1C9E78|nr:uncharacterized protein LOC9658617 [Selaginella moellendorffii]|eukprot:XP_024529376.1 uncharacterized protein LOC9658617 [Selaginella moellendorffii]